MKVLVDTGVWYALCDPRDRPDDRQGVERLARALRYARVLLPWPVLYETIRTRLAKNSVALGRMESLLARLDVELVTDDGYRNEALRLSFEMSLRKRPARPLSMVDCLIRLILLDPRLKIDRFATYNERDFHDVCEARVIEMVR